MKDYTIILTWFTKNLLKIIFFLFTLIIFYIMIKIFIPIFEIASIFIDITNNIQNFVLEFEKKLDDFNWDVNKKEKSNEKQIHF